MVIRVPGASDEFVSPESESLFVDPNDGDFSITGDIYAKNAYLVGIVSASSPTGVVTYYGDGSKLTGVITGIAGIGLSNQGAPVGSGATIIDFRGPGITGVSIDATSGIGTVTIGGSEELLIEGLQNLIYEDDTESTGTATSTSS